MGAVCARWVKMGFFGGLKYTCYVVHSSKVAISSTRVYLCLHQHVNFPWCAPSAPARVTLVRSCQTLSYVSEGAIFIYVGMDTLDPLKWKVRGNSDEVCERVLQHATILCHATCPGPAQQQTIVQDRSVSRMPSKATLSPEIAEHNGCFSSTNVAHVVRVTSNAALCSFCKKRSRRC